jgi:hypothetical protein
VARASQALPLSLHTYQQFLAESHRTLVPRVNRQADPSRFIQQQDKLIDVIENFISNHDNDPKPFIWSASVDRILAKIAKIRQQTATLH